MPEAKDCLQHTASPIVLVNPPSEMSKERQYAKADRPRIGLAYLAAYLERDSLPTRVIDCKFEGLDFRQTLTRIREYSPSLVGLTAMTPEITHAAKLAQELKKELPELPIVIGGAHATALPMPTLEEFSDFDFLVFGEGEATLVELFIALSSDQRLDNIEGLAFRNKKEVVCNRARPFIKNVDELPFPAWHLFPAGQYYPVLASRGCPFKCNFCNRILGTKIRARSADNVVKELEAVHTTYRAKRFVFHDETFLINRVQAYQLLNLIIEKGLPQRGVTWDMATRVDTVDYELLKKLRECGCTRIGFGIESGNQQILDATGKGITLEKAREAVALANKAGLKTTSYFILGHPNETRKTVHDTITFAAKLNTTAVAFGIMVPYPGTEIAEMAKRGEGNYRLLSGNWTDYGKQVGNALELTNLDRKELEKLQFLGYLKFYLHNFSLYKLKLLLEIVSPTVALGYLSKTINQWLARWSRRIMAKLKMKELK